MRSSSATAMLHALSKPSAILIGWMPRSRRDDADSRSAPARTARRARGGSQCVPPRRETKRRRGESGGRTDNARRAVADLVVLRLGELDEELCDLVLDLHLAHDGGAVVGDGDVAVWRDHDLVEAARAERRLDDVAHGARGEDVRLEGLEAVHARLLLLVAYDDERPTVLRVGGERRREGEEEREGRGEVDEEGERGQPGRARERAREMRAHLVDSILCVGRETLHVGLGRCRRRTRASWR